MDPNASLAQRGLSGSNKDPLSMVSIYSHKKTTRTLGPGISVTILEEDEDEPDFQRDEDSSFRSPTWSKSQQHVEKVAMLTSMEESNAPEEHNSVVEMSHIQLIDYVSD